MTLITESLFGEALALCIAAHPVAAEAPAHRVLAHAITESGRLNQFAVGVNEDKRRGLPAESRFFRSHVDAVAFVQRMLADRRRVDAGLMGLTDRASQDAEPGSQWAAYGLDPVSVFEVQGNVCAGARILGAAYQREINRRAACDYNSGRPDCRRPNGTNGYPERVDSNARAPMRLAVSLRAPAVPAPVAPLPHDLFARARVLNGQTTTEPTR